MYTRCEGAVGVAQMIHKQVYIEPRQDAVLKGLAKNRGMSRAEIIRQAIDHEAGSGGTVVGRPDAAAWEQARAFIRSLIAQGPAAGERIWKREELHEERLSRNGRKDDS